MSALRVVIVAVTSAKKSMAAMTTDFINVIEMTDHVW